MEEYYIKKPMFKLELRSNCFQDTFCCLGEQMVQILSCIQHETSNLCWYAFDVYGTTHSKELLFPEPFSKIASTEELIKKAKEIVQFESGVFIAIPAEKEIEWDINRLPETEEIEGLQHYEAELEIRPFDVSYFEIYGMDIDIKNKIQSCFCRVLETPV